MSTKVKISLEALVSKNDFIKEFGLDSPIDDSDLIKLIKLHFKNKISSNPNYADFRIKSIKIINTNVVSESVPLEVQKVSDE